MATFPAFLDTNVLFGFQLNDVLLALAERGLFRPLWSADVLEELRRNLVAHGVRSTNVERRIFAMTRWFPDAAVTGYGYLVPAMTCDPKDRHVLAAAVRANAEVLVTFNVKDFPPESTAPYDIEVVHTDAFLLDQLNLFPGLTAGAIRQLVADYSRPEMSVSDVLVRLADAGVPRFAATVRTHL
ncbi:PIN domain-containing protein [Subtercola sp. Z020]|uniref:PIN domain-containing protein n=1 Tax=Subtercola sp. Z020 TaxID=2080582 RepID=UPI000CE8A831|nr:PIN domain-containing protein [Subtercola sp. Z020]PPF81898.1 PIN domain-containing protein [Subtercola sp. Z020]